MVKYKDHTHVQLLPNQAEVPCFICGSSANLSVVAKENRFKISQCKTCKLLFVTNPPSATEIKEYYDEFYSIDETDGFLDQGSGNHDVMQRVCQLIEDRVSEGALLEIGGGFGYLQRMLHNSPNNHFSLHCIEPDKLAVDHIQKNYPFVHTYHGSVFDFNFEEPFDVIVGIGSFEHIQEQGMLFENTYRWLKKGGILLFCVPNIEGFFRATQVFPFVNVPFLAPQHFYDYNPTSVKRIAEKYNFTLEHIEISPVIDITKDKPVVKVTKALSQVVLKTIPAWCLWGGGINVIYRK